MFAIANHLNQFRQMRLYFFLLSSLLLIAFAGFREAGVGADDLVYVMRFQKIPDISYWLTGEYVYSYQNALRQEVGYTFLGSLIALFTKEYVYLFLIVSFLSVGIASYNYYKLTPFIFLTLVLFFVHTYLYRDMNQIRSAIVAALGLFLVTHIHNKQYFRALFTVFFASMFHLAAFSYLILILASLFKVTRARLLIGVIIAMVFGLLGFSSILLMILPDLGLLSQKISGYANSFYADSVELFDITNIKNIFFFLVFIFFWNELKYKVKYFETMMLFYFLAVSWRIAFSDLGLLAARIATFYGVVEVLLIPALLYVFKQKIFGTIIILFYAFSVLYLNLFVKGAGEYYNLSIGLI